MESVNEKEQLDVILGHIKDEEHPLHSLYLELVLGGPNKLQSILAVHSSLEEIDITEEEIQDKVISGSSLQYLQVEDSLKPKTQFHLSTISFEFVKISRLILIRSLKHCTNLKKLTLNNAEIIGECDIIITLPNLTHYTWFDVHAEHDLNPLYKNEAHSMWFFNSEENDTPGLESFWKKGEFLDFQSFDFKLKIDRENAFFQCGGISWANRYEIEQTYLNQLISYLQVPPRVFKLQNVLLPFNPIAGLESKSSEIKELELSDLKLETELLQEILSNCSKTVEILTLTNSWRSEEDILPLAIFTSLKITNLTLKCMEISVDPELNLCLESLENLDLIGCKLPKDFLSKIELQFPGLVSLSIHGCEFGTEKGVSGHSLELLMKVGKLRLITINGSGDNPGFHWGWGVFSQASKQLQSMLKQCGSPATVTSARFQRIGEEKWRYIPGFLP